VLTAMQSGATSWSMEEVHSSKIIKILEKIRQKHRNKIAYDVFHCIDYGVPQTRTRLLAGTPSLIAKLQRLRHRLSRRSVRDVISKPRGTHIRGSKSNISMRKKANPQPGEAKYTYEKASLGDNCTSIDGPAPTIPTIGAAWVTKEHGKKAHSRLPMLPVEVAALQTFPADYKWPARKELALRQIGNAVPPLLAQLFMQPEEDAIAAVARPVSPSLALHPE
jgi:site-specific DNA-cytosine methylase